MTNFLDKNLNYFCFFEQQAQMSLPHPTTLTSIHASLPHFLPSPALASPVGSSSSQPSIAVSNAPCSTLFVANLGQFVSEHELKEIFNRFVQFYSLLSTYTVCQSVCLLLLEWECAAYVGLICFYSFVCRLFFGCLIRGI